MTRQSYNDEVLIFVMRHGEAELQSHSDESRRLTTRGQHESSLTALWLKQQYCRDGIIDNAFISPYTRAQQTANEVSDALTYTRQEICADIIPDGDAESFHAYFDAVMEKQSAQEQKASDSAGSMRKAIIFSHMPLVSFLVDELCRTNTMALFATSSVAVIRYSLSMSKGELLYHYQPSL